MYNLGEKRGARYIDELNFLQGTFLPQEIYIRTTNIRRTIDSARCVIAGMFGKERLKGNVTMYTHEEESEYLYPNFFFCGYFKRWFEYASTEGVNLVEGYHSRQRKIRQDMDCEDKFNLAIALRDIVATMMAHDMEVPQVILQNWNVIEEQAAKLFVAVYCGLPHKRKAVLGVGIGKFLEEIIDNIDKKIDGRSQYKMMLYSVHDHSIVCLLVALGLFDDQWPVFAADLAFELYREKNQEYYVKVLYKGEEKVLPGCSSALCPLNKFKKLVSEYFIEDWEQECQVVMDN